MNHDEYHTDFERVSHSMMEVFRRSRVEYYARFIAKTMAPTRATPPMILGSATHCLILEPEHFGERFTVDRKDCGKQFLTALQFERAHGMAEAVRKNGLLESYRVFEPRVERPIYWELRRDEFTLRCKARPDLLALSDESFSLCELKTTSRPHRFMRDIEEYGYHRQIAYYELGIAANFPRATRNVSIDILAVGSSEPHETHMYSLPAALLLLGRVEMYCDVESLVNFSRNREWLSPARHESLPSSPRIDAAGVAMAAKNQWVFQRMKEDRKGFMEMQNV